MKKLIAGLFAAVAAAVSTFGSMPPSPYVPVEWVQLSGNGTSLAKISTGVVIEETMKLEFKVSLDDTVNYGSAFKDYIDEGHNTTRIIRAETSGDTLYVCFHSKAEGSTRVTALKNATDPIEGWMMKGQANINGVTAAISTTQGTANDTPLCFQSKENSSMHFYYLRIYNSGDLQVEYVPCVNANNPTDCGIWNGTEVLKSATGTVTAGPAAKLTVAEIKAQAYTGLPVEPELTVTFGGSVLTKGTDYSVTYANNVSIGEATATVTGLNGYSGMSAEAKFQIKEIETYDGRLIGGAWGTASNWEGGEVVDGVGKKITTKWQSITMPYSEESDTYRDVTVGSLHFEGEGTAAPTLSGDWKEGKTFGNLVFDTGSDTKVAKMTFEPLLNGATPVGRTFNMKVDLLLKSDLDIVSLRENDADFTGSNDAFLWLYGNISDGGSGHGFSLSAATPATRLNVMGDNDFTGDVNINKGRVSLWARDRVTGPATQLGHDNTIRIKDGGTLDIGNFSLGADQNLEIEGAGYNGGNDANGTPRPSTGALAVSGRNRTDHPTIAGTVTLTGDATLGNGVNSARGAVDGNDLDITGQVTDNGEGHELTLLGRSKVKLTNPANEIGSIVVNNGLLAPTSAGALGTKSLLFTSSSWTPDGWSWNYLNGGLALYPGFDITDHELGLSLTVNKNTWNRPVKCLCLATEDGDVTFASPLNVASATGDAAPAVVKFGPDCLTLPWNGDHADLYVYGGGLKIDFSQSVPEAQASIPGAWGGVGVSEVEFLGGESEIRAKMGFGALADMAIVRYSGEFASGSKFLLSCEWNHPYSLVNFGYANVTPFIVHNGTLNHNFAHPTWLWNDGEAFCRYDGFSYEEWSRPGVSAYKTAETEWTTDSTVADKDVPHVDAKGDIATTVPDGARAATLRFCDPNVRTLDLEGRLSVMLTESSGNGWGHGGGAILVTPQMGEGDIVIRGGELTGTSSYDYYLYIHQWNTNATLKIASDIVNPADGKALSIIKTGPGTVEFSGKVQATGAFVILGGEVVFTSPDCWTVTPNTIRMMNGATLTLKGGDYGTKSTSLTFGMGTSTFNLADAASRIRIKEGSFYPYAKVSKTGPGTLAFTGGAFGVNSQGLPLAQTAEWTFDGGFVVLPNSGAATSPFSGAKTLVRCRNDVTISPAKVLNSCVYGDWVSPLDRRQGLQFRIEGDADSGAIFDLAGTEVALGSGSAYESNGINEHDVFTGNGRLKIVNSSDTAAVIYFAGMFAPSFTGVFDAGDLMDRYKTTGGIPNGILRLTGTVFGANNAGFSRYNYAAFGGLTGPGALTFPVNAWFPAPVVIGRDADETVTFDGRLTSSGSGYLNYIKRGSNTQAFTCPSNTFASGWQVRDGALEAAGAASRGGLKTFTGGWGSKPTSYGVDYSRDLARRGSIDGNDASKGANAFTDLYYQKVSLSNVSEANPLWTVYGFKYPQRINALALLCSSAHQTPAYPTRIIVSGSDDGEKWTDLAAIQVTKGNSYPDWWYAVEFENERAWMFYRMSCVAPYETHAEDGYVEHGGFGLYCTMRNDGSLGNRAITIGSGRASEHEWVSSALATAGDSAAFLTGAPVTNGNKLAFGTVSKEAVVGTAHASGTSVFTSDLDLTRDVTLHAEGSSEAVFTGFITGSGAIKVSGTGKVSFKSPVTMAGEDWAFDDLTGLTFEGGLAVPEGTVLDLSGIVDKLAPGGRYALITAPGGFTGSFTVTGLPDTWNAKWKKGVLTVYKTHGLMLLVW